MRSCRERLAANANLDDVRAALVTRSSCSTVDRTILPLPMARGAQTAIDSLEKACGHDPNCAAHFPHFAEHFAAVARRFDAGPVTLEVDNPVTHRRQAVQLTKEVFAETIRHELYFAQGGAYMPVTINAPMAAITCRSAKW